MARRKLARTFQICANAADAKAVRPPWRMMRYRRSAAVISVARTTVVCSLFAGGRLCFGGSCLLLRCWPPGAHHHHQQQCATCIALSESADVAIRHKIHFLFILRVFLAACLAFSSCTSCIGTAVRSVHRTVRRCFIFTQLVVGVLATTGSRNLAL
jgi:hypothetical protein